MTTVKISQLEQTTLPSWCKLTAKCLRNLESATTSIAVNNDSVVTNYENGLGRDYSE